MNRGRRIRKYKKGSRLQTPVVPESEKIETAAEDAAQPQELCSPTTGIVAPFQITAMADKNVSLKLLVDAEAHKVLFAEAGKDFVDFLFNLLSLPVGTVISLLTSEAMVGCIGNLYQSSVENLNGAYMQPNQNKALLIKPKAPTNENAASTGEGGYVKGLVTYMVTDDLSVMPMSMMSGISILNKFSVTKIDALEEKVVEFGIDEGLKLLKGSLQSKAALTYVFLGEEGDQG